MARRLICTLGMIITGLFVSCSSGNSNTAIDPEYRERLEHWKTLREKNVKNNWATLSGLYWLETGENSFGSDSSSTVMFPAGTPAKIGVYYLFGDDLQLVVEPGVEVLLDDSVVSKILISNEFNPKLRYDDFEWLIIKRGNEFGIRLWDQQSENLKTFKDLVYYPLSNKWVVEAEFHYYDPPKLIPLENVVEMLIDTPSPGYLSFEIGGQPHTLDMLDGGEEEFFVIFADQTNEEETYNLGRYMYIPRPGEDNITYLDFNKAFNPPCAFTAFATCPLPPTQNVLSIPIRAGEKAYH